jgi:16S rRNA (guanine527-N7)-methyltransferase
MDQIFQYFPDLNSFQKKQIETLFPLYKEWNDKVNLISRKDFDNLYERHILHSLAIAKFIDFKKDTTILDVGTGGGFPGIPLAILFPHVKFHLVDSIGKKIAVVQDVITRLELKNTTCEQIRCEQLTQKYDFIVSRAVTSFPEFVNFTKDLINQRPSNSIKNGIIYLKGGDITEEIAVFKKKVSVIEISNYFENEFFATKKIIYLPFY